MKLSLIAALIAGLIGFWLGDKLADGKCAKAENARLEAQIRLVDLAEERRKKEQKRADDNARRLATSESERVALSRQLQEEIEREPTTEQVIVEVPGECEPVVITLVDPVVHYRLWNNALARQSDSAVRPTLEAGGRDDRLWRTSVFARVDGNHRHAEEGRREAMGE